MVPAIKLIFRFGPLIFAAGFLAPLTAEIIRASDMATPFGLTPPQAGFAVALPVGLIAQIRGRWI